MTLRIVLTDATGVDGLSGVFGAFVRTSNAQIGQAVIAAQTAATQSANSATTAGINAGVASSAAGAAAGSAVTAGNAATAASGFATAASGSATAADMSAQAAAGSATGAGNSASAASASAGQASGSAGNAAQSASDAATSASQASTVLAGAMQKSNNLSDVANVTTARANLGAAKSGANSDITSLTGLTTALSVAQGGTGATTAAAARTSLAVPGLAGNTFTAGQTFSAGGAVSLTLNDTSGTGTPRVIWNNNGTNAWALIGDNTAGTLRIIRYVAGVATDNPWSIAGSTGVISFSARPVFNGATPWDSSNLPSPLGNGANNFTGNQTITASNAALILNDTAAGGSYPQIIFQKGGVQQWQFISDDVAGLWSVSRYSSAGAFQDKPFSISQATGIVSFAQTPTTLTPAANANNTQVATTQYADRAVANAVPATKLRYFNTSGQSIANSGFTVVTGWTKDFDANNDFNAATGVFTVPKTGYYYLSGAFKFAFTASNAGEMQMVFTVSGIASNMTWGAGFVTGSVNPAIGGSGLYFLTAGATVTLGAYQGSTAARTLATSTYVNMVSIHQIQ